MDLYTSDDEKFRIETAKVRKFISDAIEDGWDISQTYEHESIDRACRLQKEGYLISFIIRPKENSKLNNVLSVSGWADDRLVISVPQVYSWSDIINAKSKCNYCTKEGVETVRVGFAGRICKECESTVKPKVEFPGWTD